MNTNELIRLFYPMFAGYLVSLKCKYLELILNLDLLDMFSG